MMLLMAAVLFMAAVLHGKISSLLLLCLASSFEPSMLLLCMVLLSCLLHLPESSLLVQHCVRMQSASHDALDKQKPCT